MADLVLNIKGDSSQAQEALRGAGDAAGAMGEDVGKSVAKWSALVSIATEAAKAVARFGVDSVKAYAESEKVQKQLTRAAGEYADVLSEQAEALSKKFAVDDDIIKQSQVLLTQWGGVGAATEDVTKAILDYAAATGQDAVSATNDLIRNVESGGVGLAKLGVHFQSTGDKGRDLAAAVSAISGKFGGAAKSNADSLIGQTEAATLAFEDFQKTLGQFVANAAVQTGVLGKLRDAMRGLNELMTGDEGKRDEARSKRLQDWVQAQQKLVEAQQFLAEVQADPKSSQGLIEMFTKDVQYAQEKVDALRGSAQKLDIPAVTGRTNAGMKDDTAAREKAKQNAEEMARISKKNADDLRAMFRDIDELDDHAEERRKREVESFWKVADEEAKARDERMRDAYEFDKKMAQLQEEELKRAEQAAQKEQEELAKSLEDSVKQALERVKAAQEQARQTADAIGAAFVNALTDQLSKLASGGEFDIALFVGDLLAAVVATAAGVIGTAFGVPALGAAVGNLASMGIRAGAGAISAANKPRKYHSGGWVGDEAGLPRYHSGTWVGPDEQRAILQHGERVLSRGEVSAMGGPGAVDSAARGRGAVTVNISAIDSKSAAESFMSDLGAGMRRALRSGRGDVPALLGVPR